MTSLEEARDQICQAISDHEDAVLRNVRDKLLARGLTEAASFVDPDVKHPDFGWTS